MHPCRVALLGWGLCAALVATPAPAADDALTIVRTLGGDDDDLLLHRPSCIAFAADSSAYVLNSGDSQVLHFDASWNFLGSFGSQGEGPGEFSRPVGMVIYQNRVWVFEMARISVFDLAGAYVETLHAQHQFSGPTLLGDEIFVRMGAGRRPVAQIDALGEVVALLGGECPLDFFEAFKTCRNVQILPHPEYRCVLMNLISGHAQFIGADGRPAGERNIVSHEGVSAMDHDEEAGTVSLAVNFVLGLGCLDAQGRYWTLEYPAGGEETYLTVRDSDLEPICDPAPLPGGAQAFRIYASPRGRLLLVDESGSTIYVCEVAPHLAGP